MSSTSDTTAEAQISEQIDELIDATTAALESAGAAGAAIEIVEAAGEAVVESVEEVMSNGENLDGEDDAREAGESGADLRERVDDLEDDLERTRDVARAAVGTAQTNESRLDDLETDAEETREIARCAVATAEQVDATVRDDDTADEDVVLPTGVEPSTSPLDFFANCREQRVKEMYVEESNRDNRYRAIAIAKRWQEFATRRNDGGALFWSRDDVKTALTAHLGESPHGETVSRVYEELLKLGSDDVEQRRHQVGRSQTPKDVVWMDIETARGLLEKRYHSLDLLGDSDISTTAGTVTPVVIEQSRAAP